MFEITAVVRRYRTNMQAATIIKAGNSILKSPSKVVTNFGTKELNELIEHLFFNLEHYHGVGIAAPQIGEGWRIFAYGFSKNSRYPDVKPIEKTVLINPEIYFFSKEINDFYEGCLSIPNIRGMVSRSTSIKFKAQTINGELLERTADGFEARIIQHELDHLDGVLFPERMSNLKTITYTEN